MQRTIPNAGSAAVEAAPAKTWLVTAAASSRTGEAGADRAGRSGLRDAGVGPGTG